ncbi:MAG: pyrroloquinoline quinone biosynthesis peptide chaperone PqqD [Alphaproteobacteria bacterium]|nr:pyrroloquinoline quinone biosynthesis peptide chaperone PqqD [Alphaproteobacteria bacterium]
MSAPALTGASRPRLARGVKRDIDKARGTPILQAPERVLVLDEVADAILQRCDGAASVAEIALDLAAIYHAPRETIEADMLELLEDLLEKGYVQA